MRTKRGRTKITIETPFVFKTELMVRITDLNYGNHLANDKVLSLIHEGRARFLESLGYSEIDTEGAGTIVSDVEIQYKNQAYYGNVIEIGIAVADWHRKGLNIMYRLYNKSLENITALAKTGFVFFDYEQQKPVPVPIPFKEKIEALELNWENSSNY